MATRRLFKQLLIAAGKVINNSRAAQLGLENHNRQKRELLREKDALNSKRYQDSLRASLTTKQSEVISINFYYVIFLIGK